MSVEAPLKQWHKILEERNVEGLKDLLADDAVMVSPVLFKPQEGKDITHMYLTAALHVFGNETFRYKREFTNDNGAVLEFETEIEGILVNGVDMITFNDEGKISEFRVMVRPLKGLNKIHEKMGQMLESFQALS